MLAALPPLLMLVGDAEVMLADSTEFAARASEAGAGNVRLRIYPRMWHVWPMYEEACGQARWPPVDGQASTTLAPASRALGEVARWFGGGYRIK